MESFAGGETWFRFMGYPETRGTDGTEREREREGDGGRESCREPKKKVPVGCGK